MLRRLGIRGKVLAALSVPVLVLFLLAGFVSLESVREAQTARTVATLLTALQSSRDVATALQAERRIAAPFVTGVGAVGPEKDASRAATEDAVVKFERAVSLVDFAILPPEVSASVTALRSGLDSLPGIRGRVDANVPVGSVLNNYTTLVDAVVQFPDDVADSLSDRRLAAVIAAHTAVMDLAEHYHEEQVVGGVALSGAREPADFNQLATLFPASKITHAKTSEVVRGLNIHDLTVPPLGASFVNPDDGGDGTSFDGFRTLLATTDAANFPTLTEASWTQSVADEIQAFDDLKSALRIEASDRAGEVASAALRTSVLTIGAAVAAVLLSVITALAIARQIINPLRRLTEAAAMVRDELPRLVDQVSIPGQGPDLTLTRIPVTSKDEIGQLATAFNEVNTTTIQVAQEQAALRGSIAEMFVNVARRDQILLNRQLSFIDALERSEEDPKTLADLFRLDHLATRMRRNAESLLVLAGIDTGRRLRETLALSDVIRTASSEIEHYERVQLDLPVDPMMLGHTALPAAHMMAELLENATVFSEPGTPVQVSTGVDEESVIITITDQGLGMTPFELAEANTKIRATSAGDVLGSQRLGMFVVGRIAARLGASVELGLGPNGTGTIATIRMPQVLFVDSRSLPITPPSKSAPAEVETFVLPDEAAEVVHDQAFAPAPEHVQDVAAGALGSAENPAEAVDLEALTDGTTGLGLPRRRASQADVAAPAPSLSLRDQDDAAAAPSIPLAPSAASLAGAAGAAPGAWTPPSIQASTPLASRRPDAAPAPATGLPSRPSSNGVVSGEPSTATGGLPTRAGSLPTRQPAAPVAAASAESTSEPANPEGRSATFRGFRSRRAELAAAAVTLESGDTRHDDGLDTLDGAERLAAAAATAGFFGRPKADEAPAPLVIPSLVDDDDDFDAPYVEPVEAVQPAAVAHQPVAERAGREPAEPEPAAAEPAASWLAASEQAATEQAATEQISTEQARPDVAERHEDERLGSEPVVAEAPGAVVRPAPHAIPTQQTRRRGRHALPSTEEEPAGWVAAPAAQAAAPAAPVTPLAPVTWEGQPSQEAVSAPQLEQDAVEQADVSAWETESAEQPWFTEGEQQPPAAAAWDSPEAAPWTEPDEAQPWAVPVDDQGAASWPPAFAAGEQQVGLDQLPPDPFAEQDVVGAAGHGAPAASGVAAVADKHDAKPAKRKFGLFGRKRAKEQQAEPADALPAAFAEMEPMVGFSSVAPIRQSAWSSTDSGAHTLEEPAAEAPAFQPDTFEPVAAQPTFDALPAPAFEPPAFEPPTFTPAAFEPAAFEPSADPVWHAPEAPVWQAAAPAAAPAWQTSAQAAVAAQDAGTEAWAPTPAWGPDAPSLNGRGSTASAPAAPAPSAPAPGHFSPQTTFTPHPLTGGAFDDEVTNMLAQRADLAQQALAELSQLSSYRPKAATGGETSTLVRRTPGSIPAAPAIELRPPGQRVERDANQVRSLISNFQSGTSRGRQASDTPAADDAAAPQNPGENTHAGQQDGPDGLHGEPVTTPDTDLTQRSTSW